MSKSIDSTFIIKGIDGIEVNKYKVDNKATLENNFTKVAKSIFNLEIQSELIIDTTTPYFNVVNTVKSNDKTMSNSEEKIDAAFKQSEKKIKEIDELNIDEILKKYKI